MAKMFYTLDEAAAKLGMSTDEVQALVESGQLQEFRDRDNLMFKVDQVDLLGGDDDDDLDGITLADTAMGGTGLGESGIDPISLSASASASALALEASGDATGVSIFDADDDDDADSNAETLVSGGGLGGIALGGSGTGIGGSGFGMDAGASGSGLSQLAFEPDDTSLGGNLLDDLAADSQGGASGIGGSSLGASAIGAPAGSALFEGAESTPSSFAPQHAAMPMAMPMGEVYDGPASGLFGGIALGSLLVLMLAMAVMILGLNGGSDSVLAPVDQNMLYMVMGGSFGLVLVLGGIGWAMLRKG
ncbi:MAG: helix-turn-helix domain-containing protein [Phycisphaerales bacterium]|nr:helix-turn-helix domain-containing protein [Phycisphaerales bacterium]